VQVDKYRSIFIFWKRILMEACPHGAGQAGGNAIPVELQIMETWRYFFFIVTKVRVEIRKDLFTIILRNCYRHYGYTGHLPGMYVAKTFYGICMVSVSTTPGPTHLIVWAKINHAKRPAC